jgi:hypothetical protein
LISRFFLEPVDRPLLEELQCALRSARDEGYADSDEYATLQAVVGSALAWQHELWDLQSGFARLLRALVPHPDFPDHVGAELRMMSNLCLDELQAWRSRSERKARAVLRQELRFLDGYVVPGLPRLRAQLPEVTSHPFGPVLVAMMEVACRKDREALYRFLRGECEPLLGRASWQMVASGSVRTVSRGWQDAVH